MAFGFPAFAEASVTHSLNPKQIDVAVEDALAKLGWRFSFRDGVFQAFRGVSIFSWGERITIDVSTPGVVALRSRCRFSLQCVDWGRNQRNIRRFLSTIDLG